MPTEDETTGLHEKILIIDSHPVYIKKLEGFLYGLTYTNIFLAKSGEEGIGIAKSKCPDLIISSSLLADMSGIELCRQIRQLGLVSKIIILTGLFVSQQDISIIKNQGADEVLLRKEKDMLPLQQAIVNLMTSSANEPQT